MPKNGQGVNERNYASGPGAAVQGEERTVKLSAVQPNRYNYNTQSPVVFNKLIASMREFGFTLPIIVRRVAKGRFEIIDGEHRWRAAKELAMPEVRVIDLGEVPDEKAKQLTIILNELGGSADQVRLAELLRDINTDVSFDDLAKVMPYSDKELNALIDAVDFSFASLSDEDTRPKAVAEADASAEEDAPPTKSAPATAADAATEAEEDVRADMPASLPKTARIVLHVPADEVKEFEMRLMKVHDNPVEAIKLAVDAYLIAKKATEAVMKEATAAGRARPQKGGFKP